MSSPAADGTDPELLRDVVAAALADEAGLRRRVAQASRDHGPDVAVRRAVGAPLCHDASVDAVLTDWVEHDARVALAGDPGYPARLLDLSDPPPWLACRGPGHHGAGGVVAIVGSRAATGYGRGVAAWLAESASAVGVHVVSGGARGIDAAAHAAALDRSGGTAVVLGCGHAVSYPRVHAHPGGLFDRIVAAGGAVWSESLPRAQARPHRIRARNRIVAGLADVVVVVEGRARSGSLITATAAADQGASVLAVPGDVRAPGSVAPHRLLAEGAAVCRGPEDLLDALALVVPGRGLSPPAGDDVEDRRAPSVLPSSVRAALEQAWPRPVPLETLASVGEQPVGRLLATLTRARIGGEVALDGQGARLRRSPRSR